MCDSRALLALLALPLSPVHAQSEAALRRECEGTSVIARIDMPGTSSGVNVYPSCRTGRSTKWGQRDGWSLDGFASLDVSLPRR